MSLTNLSQIKGLAKLRGKVNILLQSYDAAKVITQIVKAEGEGNYNVDELLASLKAKLDAITGEAGGSGETRSLESLREAIDGLKNKAIKAYTGDAEEPVKEYKLFELPEDALLQNDELDITAYQNALDALTDKLAANRKIIEAVKELISNKSVQDSIDEAIAEIEATLALKGDKSVVEKADADLKILDTKIEELEDSTLVEIQDVIALGETQAALPLSDSPEAQEVRLYINGAVYYENDDFTVDRKAKTLTWTLADFELTSAIAAAGLGFDPSLIQVDDSKITLTREEPQKSFNVTVPADCTVEVVPSDPDAVEITITEV